MNRCNIPHAPSTGLSGTQFSTLNSAGINDPEGPDKYNNTEEKLKTANNKDTLINTVIQKLSYFEHTSI
jgi:hypothetical protein